MKVAWIGTGLMGLPMATRLLQAGHDLVVHTRTKERADTLLAAGAAWADSPLEAAANRDVVCTMLPFPADVESAYLGPAGALAACRSGAVAIDMSTSSPELARRIATDGLERGVSVLDAPVSGGPVGAESGALSIMVGGSLDGFTRVRPLLEALGATVVRHGDAGAGQSAKLVNQILIAGVMGGIAEGFAATRALGLDPSLVLGSVEHGAAGSFLLSWAWPRLLAEDLAPGFKVEHFLKDLRLALQEAAAAGLELPVTQLVAELYRRIPVEHGDKGTQSLVQAIPRR